MPSTIYKCELFTIKHNTLLEGKTFLRYKHKITLFKIKRTFFGRKENTINLLRIFMIFSETYKADNINRIFLSTTLLMQCKGRLCLSNLFIHIDLFETLKAFKRNFMVTSTEKIEKISYH